MKDKSVLITGVNGHIGSKIADSLVQKKRHVIGIDLASSNINALIEEPNFAYFKADITDPKSFTPEFEQVDTLIHCAALVHRSSKNLSRENYFKINQKGTKNILSFLDKKQLKHVIFLSTVSVYGTLAQGKIPDESSPINPVDFYGESKCAAENEMREFLASYEIPYTILRLAPVYGDEFLLNIKKRVYVCNGAVFYKIGSGEQKISLCAINNVVDIVAESLDNQVFFNETYVVKDINNYSMNEIIEVLKSARKQQRKPVIQIPKFFIETAFKLVSVIFPKKGGFYQQQVKKISHSAIYSGKKLKASGIQLNWDLNKTFLNS